MTCSFRGLAIAMLVAIGSLTVASPVAAAPHAHAKKPRKKLVRPATPIPVKEPPLTVTPPEEKKEEEPPPAEKVEKVEEAPPTPVPAAPPSPEPRKLELGGRLFSYARTPFAFDKPVQQV